MKQKGFLIACVFTVFCMMFLPSISASAENPLKIGVYGPMTGPASETGECPMKKEEKKAEEKPVEESKEAEEKPVEESKEAEAKPVEESKEAEEKPVEESKEAEEKPVEESKEAEEKPAEESKEAEEKPAEESKEAEEDKDAEVNTDILSSMDIDGYEFSTTAISPDEVDLSDSDKAQLDQLFKQGEMDEADKDKFDQLFK